MPYKFKAPNATNPYSANWLGKFVKRSGDDIALCSAATDRWLGVVVSVNDALGGSVGVAMPGEIAPLLIGTTIDVSSTDLISPDADGAGAPRVSPNRAAAQLVQHGDAAAGRRPQVRVLGWQETAVDAGLPYAVDDTTDWPGADPAAIDAALDLLAARMTAREADLVLNVALADEADDARVATVTCVDSNGDAVAAAEVFIELLDANATPADMATEAFNLTTGTANSGDLVDSNVAMRATADAGSLVVEIKDKSTALVGSLWLKLTPINRRGPARLIEVAFT